MKSSSVFEKAYGRLYEMIMSGELPAGTRLVEIPLSEKMSVSRTTIRHALSRLKDDGLVEDSIDEGVRVKIITSRDILDLYEFRILIECHCARKVLKSSVDALVLELRKYLKRLKAVYEHFRDDMSDNEVHELVNEYFYSDLGFHLSLIKTSNNPYIISAARKLYLMSSMFNIHNIMYLWRKDLLSVDFFKALYNEHEKIVEAFASASESQVIQMLERHIVGVRELILRHLVPEEKNQVDQGSEKMRDIFRLLSESS